MDRKEVASIAKSKVNEHVRKMHKLKKGGPTSMDMKKMGRNMARVRNQGGK